MPEHHPHREQPDLSRHYETSDLSFPTISRGVLLYFLFTGAIGAVVLAGFLLMHQTTPEKIQDQLPPQPYPLLQNNTTAVTDIRNLRQREDYILDNYTWADPQHRFVRVPVDSMLKKIGGESPTAIETLPNGYEATPQPPFKPFGPANASTTPSKPGLGGGTPR